MLVSVDSGEIERLLDEARPLLTNEWHTYYTSTYSTGSYAALPHGPLTELLEGLEFGAGLGSSLGSIGNREARIFPATYEDTATYVNEKHVLRTSNTHVDKISYRDSSGRGLFVRANFNNAGIGASVPSVVLISKGFHPKPPP